MKGSDDVWQIRVGTLWNDNPLDSEGKPSRRWQIGLFFGDYVIPVVDEEDLTDGRTRFWTDTLAKDFGRRVGAKLRLVFDRRAFGRERLSNPLSDPILEIIQEINTQGYLLNNLFQLPNTGGRWRANIMRPSSAEEVEGGKRDEVFYEYGEGDSPMEALLNASHNAAVMFGKSYMVARKKVRRTL